MHDRQKRGIACRDLGTGGQQWRQLSSPAGWHSTCQQAPKPGQQLCEEPEAAVRKCFQAIPSKLKFVRCTMPSGRWFRCVACCRVFGYFR